MPRHGDHRSRCRISADVVARLDVLLDLGLGYLSPRARLNDAVAGRGQRLRIATQLRSGLFGVVYVLDEPSAGLHPADAEPLLDVLDRLKAAGNSLFVVEHDLDVVRRADWVVDIGPGAGEGGGRVLYSGPSPGSSRSRSRSPPRTCSAAPSPSPTASASRTAGCTCAASSRHNLHDVSVDVPLAC